MTAQDSKPINGQTPVGKQPKKKGTTRGKVKKLLIAVLIIFICLIGVRFGLSRFIAYKIANTPEPVNPVTTIILTANDWTPVISTSATVRPNQGAMLKNQIAGTVASIEVTPGQMVQKGDLLVSLDTSVEEAQLAASEAQLPSAQNTYVSYAKLYKTNSVSKSELDKAQSQYKALLANISSLKATIARRQIVAPFSGIAGFVKVNVGQFINSGTDIVRVEDRSQMKVDFEIAQKYLPKLHLNQKITATTDTYKKPFTAKVIAIDPAVDPTTGLVDVQAVFDPVADQSLMSGMFVKLNLHLNTQKEQIVVPQIAISYNMYGDFVYVLEPLSKEDKDKLSGLKDFAYSNQIDNLYRVKQVPITVLDRQNNTAQVDNKDLKVNQQIVVGGMQRLNNNSLVVVIKKPLVGTEMPKELGNM